MGPIELRIIATDDSGQTIELRKTVVVGLPSDPAMQAIKVDRDQETLFLRVGANEKIYVNGHFLDGLVRDVSPSAAGTTYEVLDLEVAIVDSEGLVTGISRGRTRIIIRNADRQLQVEIRVKEKR